MEDTLHLPALQAYPERVLGDTTAADRIMRRALSRALPYVFDLTPLRLSHPIVALTRAQQSGLNGLDAASLLQRLRQEVPRLRRALRKGAVRPDHIAPALALVCTVASRTIGQDPFDVQLLAVWALITGRVAEMRTGEGKSLAIALSASLFGLAGLPVHVLTVNDYLAERDRTTFLRMFQTLGLTAGLVVDGMSLFDRREAYGADITYCTAKGIVFDYLRDRRLQGQDRSNLARKAGLLSAVEGPRPLMRGLTVALVDEADSVLIDQAGTPFILSGGGAVSGSLSAHAFARALDMARQLRPERDFLLRAKERRVDLTPSGRASLVRLSDEDGPLAIAAIRDHAVMQALTAVHALERNRDYLVAEGKVVIIDESTGRAVPDRSWSEGLHQMVELKEGLEPSPPLQTEARITLQTFFRRYRHLSGTTGTARSAAAELWEVYDLRVSRIPPRRPDRRVFQRPEVFLTAGEKWAHVAHLVKDFHVAGKAVLIGTRSLAAAEAVSHALAALPHTVLHAGQPAREAEIIAGAGSRGAITVATNMAGRGTDIHLDAHAQQTGGLHVILTEMHESARVDLQLAGRSGRQGDPGRVLGVFSLEDDLVLRQSWFVRGLCRHVLLRFGSRAAHAALRWLQWREEARQALARVQLIEAERARQLRLALSGMAE